MKNFILVLSLFFALQINSQNKKLTPSIAKTYVTEQHTSPDGKYKYSTVTNDPLGVRTYKLNNGLTVMMSVNKKEPRVQNFIATNAGSKNDPADNTGLAHYLEHMLFKGTNVYGTKDWKKE
ncbi:MAG: insulinase family protein, partial [Candidatus Methylacidiphilales bacterium]